MEFGEIIISFLMVLLSLALAVASKYVRTRVSESAWNDAVMWVELAVKAAEQVFKDIPDSGAEKYEYAFDMLSDLDLSDGEKNMLIEAAVGKMK